MLLFNTIFLHCTVPDAFKVALVSIWYKGKGARNLADSYRPISVLSPITKIFEFILFVKLRLIIEPLLCVQQHGFRTKRSCQSALTFFTQDVYKNLDRRNGRVGAVFVDLKKAFNSVNHPILLLKLIEKFNLNPHFVKLIESYLADRKFKIRNGDNVSSIFNEDGSVPQGSSLGPLLFSAYINDVGDVLNLSFFLYADDLIMYASGTDPVDIVNRLSENLSNLHVWCSENKLTISTNKTKFMFFHKANDTNFGVVPDLYLNGELITRVYKFKYLGVILDPCLTFMSHYDMVDSKLSSCLGKLYGIRKYLSVKVNRILVNAYVLSSYDYCIHIWAVQPKRYLQMLQDKINRYLYSSLYTSLFRKMRRKLKYKSRNNRKLLYYSRAQLDMNSLLVKFKILTVEERYAWTCGKYVLAFLKSSELDFNQFFQLSLNTRSSRSMPLLQIDSCNSETFRKSVKFRSCKIWNALPKNWIIHSDKDNELFIDLIRFKNMLYNQLVEDRNGIWLKF